MVTAIAYLQLTIELGSDPIAGSVGSPDEKPRRFSGWIELAQAIEQARANGKSLGLIPAAKGSPM